jgi:hypothetical protein
MKITDKINIFDDIINILGSNDIDVIHYNKLISDNNSKKYDIAEYGIILIAKVLNEGWIPNWNNTNERKWYNWFRYDSSTSRFVFNVTHYVIWSATSYGGSRLCYREESLAAFAANLFPDFYNDYYTKFYNKDKRIYSEYHVRGILKQIEYYLED